MITVTGTDIVIGNLDRTARQIRKAAAGGIREFAEIEMTEAKDLVPVDTGALRSSGHVIQPVEGDDLTAKMGFGGPAGIGNLGESNAVDVGYALIVHENLDTFHPVGQAKYLETPFRQSAIFFAARVANTMKRLLGF